MNTTSVRPVTADPSDRRHPATALIALVAACAFAVAGCGGGDLSGSGGGTDLAGVTGGGTGEGPSTPSPQPQPIKLASVKSLTSGPISDPATLRIEGIVYDTSAATVVDDAGRTRSLADLARGMVVQVEGTAAPDRSSGVAERIRIVTQAAGPVQSIDPARGVLKLLNARVMWDDATAWGSARGADALAVGNGIEVWGFVDAETGAIWATRIATTTASPPSRPQSPGDEAGTDTATPPAARDWEVRRDGIVVAYDPATGIAQIGGQSIETTNAVLQGGRISVGARIQVLGQAAATGGSIRATTVTVSSARLPEPIEYANLDGAIVRYVSAGAFEVQGFVVDASKAVFAGGTVGDLANRMRVQVAGPVRGGVLIAERITLGSPLPSPAGDEGPTDGTPPDGGEPPSRSEHEQPPPRPGGGVKPTPFCAGGAAQLVHESVGWRWELPYCGDAWRIVRVMFSGSRYDASFLVEDMKTGQRTQGPAVAISAPSDLRLPETPLVYLDAGWRYVLPYDATAWTVVKTPVYIGGSRANASFTLVDTTRTRQVSKVEPVRVEAPAPASAASKTRPAR